VLIVKDDALQRGWGESCEWCGNRNLEVAKRYHGRSCGFNYGVEVSRPPNQRAYTIDRSVRLRKLQLER